MKISGEELGEIGRKHIVLTPLILLCFLVGPIFLAAAAQSRLNSIDGRVHNLHLRQRALGEFLGLIAAAESRQRGYLLTGENSYLQLYSDSTDKLLPALDRVRASFNSEHDTGGDILVLRQLTEQELAAMAETIALRKQNTAAPLAPGRIDAGEAGMERIVNFVDGLLQNETRDVLAATEQWQSQLELTRWITAVGALIDIALVLLATRLTYDDMRRRGRQAGELRDQKEELEREATLRTAELTALSTHLQGVSEQEKSALSRELHDELGGLLVAARMDVSWLQQRLPTSDPAALQTHSRILERRRGPQAARGGGIATHAARQHGPFYRAALAVQGNLPPLGAALQRTDSGRGNEVSPGRCDWSISGRSGGDDEYPEARRGVVRRPHHRDQRAYSHLADLR
jgi:CHASE3 domain sensor protein